MRVRESNTKTPRINVEIQPPYKPTTAEVEQDIRLFLNAHDHLEDVPLKEADILNDLDHVMDNELLRGLNRVMQHWHWTQPNGLTQADMNEVFCVEELRRKVEELMRARLRDVLESKLKPARS